MKINTALIIAGLATLPNLNVAAAAETSIEDICIQTTIECLKSDAGVVIGRPGTTAVYANNIESAAQTFERYFGIKPPKAAVLLGEVNNAEIRAAVNAEYQVVLPWMTVENRKQMIANSVRSQVRRQRPDVSDDELAAIVERSVEASMRQGTGGSEDLHQGVFAHELGHTYFVRTFWPDERLDLTEIDVDAVERYAGPGPDWLDEMAAVLMENDALTEKRNTVLQQIVEGGNYDAMWSLSEYFTVVHPAFEQAREIIRARQQTAEGRAQGGVVILGRGDLPKREDGKEGITFYAQSRGFAEYMIEKTGNERIFADIAAFIVAGGSMQTWLDKNGPTYDIPHKLDALQTDFGNWLQSRQNKV